MQRECGECTLCCTLLAVNELNKKANQRCAHMNGRCSVYSHRPQSCRDFECLWLQGQIPLELKPSLVHVVVGGDERGLVVYVDPDHPNAHLEDLVRGMIEDAGEKLRVIVTRSGKVI